MPIPKGRDLIAWLMLMAVALLIVAVGISGSFALLGVTVIVVGLLGLVGAVQGKPERVCWGLTERLMQLLPDPAWRAAMATLGLAIITFGALGLIVG